MISSILANFPQQVLTLKRRATNGFDSHGVAQAPTVTTSTFVAVVVPATGRELERLPEGMRSRDVARIFSTAILKCAEPGFEPDVVTINGADWQVQLVNDWQADGGFQEVYLQRVGST